MFRWYCSTSLGWLHFNHYFITWNILRRSWKRIRNVCFTVGADRFQRPGISINNELKITFFLLPFYLNVLKGNYRGSYICFRYFQDARQLEVFVGPLWGVWGGGSLQPRITWCSFDRRRSRAQGDALLCHSACLFHSDIWRSLFSFFLLGAYHLCFGVKLASRLTQSCFIQTGTIVQTPSAN